MSTRRALLIIDHGSRQPAANELVEIVAARVRERRPGVIVEHAHMEIAAPSLADGVAACVAAGALEIIVHPYFLGSGRHTRETIPKLVAALAGQHQGITIQVSEPLGLHDKLVDVVLERVDALLE
ncbi:MAG: cobalamin biosynthesis protein CbiX [Deltaproteobacteria bacterium]|jgi:sirohydrochlorin cobaltochelatase|nr:cobalamin biosynthesis protein CbiX [Deltaproteobacteria bacterium]MBW2385227.1 cobalamin biosynthesis protein CbiX [Deltaproteobacteria bacterium]MBW2695411.1 cobalamin biosynthesis protein CbiX [Deltaproteobacteria bacterium]